MTASPSPLPGLLPDASHLTVDDAYQEDGVIVMIISAVGNASCPACGICSCHVHSRYCRTLRDLPCQGAVVRICLRTHRFYCRAKDCRRRIFTQRLPALTSCYGRQTKRYRDALLAIGYALGEEAGYRLCAQLGIVSSADTILRCLKQHTEPEAHSDVKVLGVDDWAWRRGHRYGTVLVDLERHRPIDLLPDRESETLANWLRAHPKIEIISRDRAGAYAEGARQGAPGAIQVADRFHLFCNLAQAVQRMLERLASLLRSVEIPKPSEPLAHELTPEPPTGLTQHEQRNQYAREKRKELFEAVRAAHERGVTKRAIAREFGMSPLTIRRYLQAKEFPERAPRQRRSELDSFRTYLEKRWAEGCRNASQLCRELRSQGYSGQRSRVKEYLQPWRVNSVKASSRPRRKLPNVRLVALWLTKPPKQRSPDEQRWVEAVTTSNPQISTAEHLAQQFRRVFKDRNPSALTSWLAKSVASDIPELKRFVAGIQRDYEASGFMALTSPPELLSDVQRPFTFRSVSRRRLETTTSRLSISIRLAPSDNRRIFPNQPSCNLQMRMIAERTIATAARPLLQHASRQGDSAQQIYSSNGVFAFGSLK
jgi:transposase